MLIQIKLQQQRMSYTIIQCCHELLLLFHVLAVLWAEQSQDTNIPKLASKMEKRPSSSSSMSQMKWKFLSCRKTLDWTSCNSSLPWKVSAADEMVQLALFCGLLWQERRVLFGGGGGRFSKLCRGSADFFCLVMHHCCSCSFILFSILALFHVLVLFMVVAVAVVVEIEAKVEVVVAVLVVFVTVVSLCSGGPGEVASHKTCQDYLSWPSFGLGATTKNAWIITAEIHKRNIVVVQNPLVPLVGKHWSMPFVYFSTAVNWALQCFWTPYNSIFFCFVAVLGPIIVLVANQTYGLHLNPWAWSVSAKCETQTSPICKHMAMSQKEMRDLRCPSISCLQDLFGISTCSQQAHVLFHSTLALRGTWV